MKKELKKYFGFDSFRPLQEDIIKNILDGNDAFVLMPTGGGKSLCYQLPSLKNYGITLVISPLIALMKDQVDSLRVNGISANFINSSISYNEIENIKNDIKSNKLQLLYIAPERLSVEGFIEFLQTVEVNLIAVDEAHCISEWGHDFRPDYRNLKSLKSLFPNIPIIALTATATQIVQEDIIKQLSLNNAKKFIASFNRENLNLKVLKKKNAFEKLIQLLNKHKGESAIIYCFSRKETEKIATALKEYGHNALPYHAGLDSMVRKNNQELFIKDEVPIIVATIAFGMGIDKPDVRLVVHYTFPKTLEGYYQEIGRAGRDGLSSDCVLFYSLGDKMKHEYFLKDIEDEDERNKSYNKLEQVILYCESFICRHKYMLNYFGEDYQKENCGACDFCLQPIDLYDVTQHTYSILNSILETGNRFGMSYIVKILKGSSIAKILQYNHQNLNSYSSLHEISEEEIKHIIKHLISKKFIKKEVGMYPTLSVTNFGKSFLQDSQTISIPKIKQDEFEDNANCNILNYDKELFEQLRVLRKQIASERNIPPFAVFGDQSLQEMSYYFPFNEIDFLKIIGVGSKKLEDFGDKFTDVIKTYCMKNNIQSKPIHRKVRRVISSTMNIVKYIKTKEMIEQKKSLSEIALVQGFKEDTILKHIARLLDEKYKLDISYLNTDQEKQDEINNAFEIFGNERLKPIFEFLNEKYSYSEIRLAELLRRF